MTHSYRTFVRSGVSTRPGAGSKPSSFIGLRPTRRTPFMWSFDSRHGGWAIVVFAFSLCTLTSFEANAQVLWGDSAKYDDGGRNPTVAITNVGTVVEVHNGGSGGGPLWYRVGQRSGLTIQWGKSAKYDDGGLNPTVAVTNDGTVVEVHN